MVDIGRPRVSTTTNRAPVLPAHTIRGTAVWSSRDQAHFHSQFLGEDLQFLPVMWRIGSKPTNHSHTDGRAQWHSRRPSGSSTTLTGRTQRAPSTSPST